MPVTPAPRRSRARSARHRAAPGAAVPRGTSTAHRPPASPTVHHRHRAPVRLGPRAALLLSIVLLGSPALAASGVPGPGADAPTQALALEAGALLARDTPSR